MCSRIASSSWFSLNNISISSIIEVSSKPVAHNYFPHQELQNRLQDLIRGILSSITPKLACSMQENPFPRQHPSRK